MKRFFAVILVCALSISLFAACGSSGGASSQAPASSNAPAASTPAASSAPAASSSADGPIVVTIKNRPDSVGYFMSKIDEFNETHSDIQVELQQRADTTDQEHNIMLTQLASGSNETDIPILDTCWLLEFAAAGWLEELTGYLPAGYNDAFFPIAKDLTFYNGTQYGVLRQVDLSSLYYRTDLFEEAGIEPPKTWDELVEAGKTLTTDSVWGYVWQGKQYEGLVCDWVEVLHSMGGAIFDSYTANPGERAITINSAEAARATKFMYDLIKTHKISPEGVLSYAEDPSRDVFVAGQAAMLRLWQSTPPYLEDASASQVVGKWGMVPLPGDVNGSRTCIGGWAYGINIFSDHKEAAWAVIDFFTSEDYMAGNMVAAGQQPSRMAAYEQKIVTEHPLWSDLAPMFLEIANNGTPRPLSVVWSKQSDVIQRALHDVFADNKTPEDAMAWAAVEIEKIEQDFLANKK